MICHKLKSFANIGSGIVRNALVNVECLEKAHPVGTPVSAGDDLTRAWPHSMVGPLMHPSKIMASNGKGMKRQITRHAAAKELHSKTRTGVYCAADEYTDTVDDHDHRRDRFVQLWR